jgi:phage repressor protein C with HTH and peptisase S24 domain
MKTDTIRPINRLREYITAKSYTDSAFERICSLSNGYLNKISKGAGSIGSDILLKIYNANPDLSLLWLITGEGEMLSSTKVDYPVVSEPAPEYALKSINSLKSDKKKNIQRIPLYSITATAGVYELLSEEQRSRHIPIDYISIPNMPQCDGAVPISGDSMYPLLKSGDIVLFKEVHDKQNIIWGEMYLASVAHNGDKFFFSKYIQKSDREGYARFVSENKHHQPIEFPIDSIQSIALIKASIRFQSSF